MKKTAEIGLNRTGVQMAPSMTKRMIEASEALPFKEVNHDAVLAPMESLRRTFIEHADPVGTVPVPGTMKGTVSTGAQVLKGNDPTIFLDKLGERLAFERSGVRLYDSFIAKARVLAPDMNVSRLMEIRAEEAQHFAMLRECIESLGADPTAQTPAADNVGVQSMGLVQSMNDPRTNIEQAINTLHVAELVDVDGWELLIRLAEEAGQDAMVIKFTEANRKEAQHLADVRRWHDELLLKKKDVQH